MGKENALSFCFILFMKLLLTCLGIILIVEDGLLIFRFKDYLIISML